MGVVTTCLNACTLHYDDMVNCLQDTMGGKKGSDGYPCTIPILNVFGCLERRSRGGKGKGERDTERRENWVVAHHVVIQHSEQNAAGWLCSSNRASSATPREGRVTSHIWTLKNSPWIIQKTISDQGEFCQLVAGRLPVWNCRSRRSKASGWPAPAAPLSSPGLWSRHSADSEGDADKHKQFTNSDIFLWYNQTIMWPVIAGCIIWVVVWS